MASAYTCILCGATENGRGRKSRRGRRCVCANCTHVLLHRALADSHVMAELLRVIHAPPRKSRLRMRHDKVRRAKKPALA
jgi:hypothetical protein